MARPRCFLPRRALQVDASVARSVALSVGDTFLERNRVGPRLALDEQLAFEPQPFVERKAEALDHGPLGCEERGAWFGRHRLHPCEHVLDEAVRRQHGLDEADAERFLPRR